MHTPPDSQKDAPPSVRIIGSYLSPYVRKVLVSLHVKGVRYEIDPIVPFMGDDRFTALSPLRRVPVLIDLEAERAGRTVVLCDSSVICQYIEDKWPKPALIPRDIVQAARCRWLEEFADTRMGEVFIWRLYNQLVIRRFVWNEEPDQALLHKTQTEDIPQILGYLESQLPAAATERGFALDSNGDSDRDGDSGGLTLGDIALASFFRNAGFARYTIDAARWPKTAAYVARVLATEPFQRLKPLEDRLMRTPIPEHRNTLTEFGAPLTADTLGTRAPRRGVMGT